MNLADIIAVLVGLEHRFHNDCRMVFRTPDNNSWSVDRIAVDTSYPRPHIVLTQTLYDTAADKDAPRRKINRHGFIKPKEGYDCMLCGVPKDHTVHDHEVYL